ncbi:hypothetical protein OH492_26195 [Vibrio chagasii]|nr:hypothetical protein [Vibrio chagasii]
MGWAQRIIIVEEVPTKSALDLVAIVFTILGGGATFVATCCYLCLLYLEAPAKKYFIDWPASENRQINIFHFPEIR